MPIAIKYIIIYLIVINLIGFLLMWMDKKKAKKHKWRIQENTFITVTLLGGGIGTIVGMYAFHHKTKKLKFTVGLPVILITEIFIVIYICYLINKGGL